MVIPDFTAFNSLYWAHRSTSLKASADRSEEMGMYCTTNRHSDCVDDYYVYNPSSL